MSENADVPTSDETKKSTEEPFEILDSWFCPLFMGLDDRPSPSQRKILKRAVFLALALISGFSDARAFWWWRDSMTSRWTDKPVQVSVPDLEWGQIEPLEISGFNFRTRNDSTNLYLMISANDRDSRSVMKGAYRQDVTLWFLGPNGKSKSWGLRLAFGRPDGWAGHPASGGEGAPSEARPGGSAMAAEDQSKSFPPRPAQERSRGFPSSIDEQSQIMEPEMVLASGIEISTALPSDIDFHSESSRRDVACIASIPPRRLSVVKGKAIPLDFVVSDVSDELKKDFEARNGDASARPNHGGSGRGGMGRGGMGGAMGRGGMGGGMGPGGMGGGMRGGGMGGSGQGTGMELSTDGNTMHGGMTGVGGRGEGQRGDDYSHLSSFQPPTLPDPLALRLSVRLARPSLVQQ